MKKMLIFFVFALFLVSFVVADNDSNTTNNDSIPYGDDGLVAGDDDNDSYTPGKRCPQWVPPSKDWCKDGKKVRGRILDNGCRGAPKCITRDEAKNMTHERNRLRVQQEGNATLPENCERHGSTLRCNVEGGRVMTITAGRSGNVIVQVKGINMSTKVELYKANETLYGVFKGNVTKPINYLPDHVKARIRERLKADLEEEEIELDEEDGLYKVKARKKARLFGFIKVRERIRVHVDPETGELVKTSGSWWGFLARDEVPVDGTCETVSLDSREECCIEKGFDSWSEEKAECM